MQDRTLEPKVHPRIRGEYIVNAESNPDDVGSPPHTRGIHHAGAYPGGSQRFTPAYAGNTVILRLLRLLRWVHPRIRGEYESRLHRLDLFPGSPPHTRGIPGINRSASLPYRFTPAYAGNTMRPDGLPLRRKVHPRIRGEYFRGARGTILYPGSPPHTRGIRIPVHDSPDGIRFTPAYAGNTRGDP